MSIPESNTVFRGINSIVQPTPFELPKTLEPKQVLLKITHSGLCGTDLHVILHSAALGHEGVGTVIAIGSGVTDFKVGDRAGAGYLRNVRSLTSTPYEAVLI
jgi:D-arabinose 1-dehydrogenase-like Zn-dependent alcohol dehydrogenase